MTHRQVKICLWVMAVTAAITGGISGYNHGVKDQTWYYEHKYFTQNNRCTIMLDNGGAVDGYCIEDETSKPVNAQKAIVLPNAEVTPCPTPVKLSI